MSHNQVIPINNQRVDQTECVFKLLTKSSSNPIQICFVDNQEIYLVDLQV